MNKSESIAELAKALSKAQGEFDHAEKDTKNEFFKSKYATLASCIDAAKPALEKNGLSVVQVTDANDAGMILTTMLIHSSGEFISGTYPIRPLKPDPQGYGSALSYARRYSFCAITGIAAEDDDGNAASGKQQVPPAQHGFKPKQKQVEEKKPTKQIPQEWFDSNKSVWITKAAHEHGQWTKDDLIELMRNKGGHFSEDQMTEVSSWFNEVDNWSEK